MVTEDEVKEKLSPWYIGCSICAVIWQITVGIVVMAGK